MTTVSSATSTTSTTTTSSTGSGVSDLDVNDFLTLMITQLQNQDPTNPQDSSEFVAQLAQFSSVSGIQEMNSSISSLLDEMRSSQALNATSLVGHDVLVEADSAPVTSGETVSGAVETPDGASSINLVITDSSGQVVRQMTVSVEDDLSTFTWDGLDDSGEAVDSGTYYFNAIANVYGDSESATTLLNANVSSVTIDPTDNTLTLNTSTQGSVSLSDVRQVI